MSENPTDEGTPNPTPSEDAAEQLERLKRENAELREERRQDRARAAAAQFGLDDVTRELLSQLPADQIEEKAKAIADSRGQSGGTPPQDPPAADPGPDPTTIAAMDAMQQSGGKTQAPGSEAPTGLKAQMQAEVANAKSLDEVEAIQARYIQMAHDTGDAAIFNL